MKAIIDAIKRIWTNAPPQAPKNFNGRKIEMGSVFFQLGVTIQKVLLDKLHSLQKVLGMQLYSLLTFLVHITLIGILLVVLTLYPVELLVVFLVVSILAIFISNTKILSYLDFFVMIGLRDY